MATRNASTAQNLVKAAGYVRMSGRAQEKSPAEQCREITKLVARKGCKIVEWQSDDAATGDSSAESRPELAGLLGGARAGRFNVLLARHTIRLWREDPMDALELYNVLRKAGCRLVTCCESDDPAVVRKVFRRLVERIDWQWVPIPNKSKWRRVRYRLVGGTV